MNPETTVAWSYKHVIINGYLFDVPQKDFKDALSTNAIFSTTAGGIFVLQMLVLLDHIALMLCKKLVLRPVIDNANNDFIYKVLSVGQRLKAVSVLNVIGTKYHAIVDKDGLLTHVVKVPNTLEVE